MQTLNNLSLSKTEIETERQTVRERQNQIGGNKKGRQTQMRAAKTI